MEKPNIVEIIGQHIPIKRSGREWSACCPFHEDRHPSFSINEEEGVFYCFGCGAAGDVFDFLMRWSGKPFSEICAYYNIKQLDKTWRRYLSATEIRNRFLARLMADWSRAFSDRVAAKLRDIGQDLQLAEEEELWDLSEVLQREWDILETLHEDLAKEEYILELYEQKDDLENLVD